MVIFSLSSRGAGGSGNGLTIVCLAGSSGDGFTGSADFEGAGAGSGCDDTLGSERGWVGVGFAETVGF